MNLRTKLAALFSPTRRLIGADPPIVEQGGILGGQQWVVPRAECQYRQVDLSALPLRQRAAAGRLAAMRHLPSPGAVAHLAWRQGTACLWLWPAPPPEVASGQQRWLPESVLLAPPAQDGPRLLRLARGVEGQVWDKGRLVLSQWWPAAPDPDAWQHFLRAGGRDPVAHPLPVPEVLPWGAPWAQDRRSLLPGTAAARERLAWLAAGGLLALVLGWELTGLLRWRMASQNLAAQLETTRGEVAPLLAARERAESAQAEIERLRQLQSGQSDYELIARVIAALPEGTVLRSWRRNPGKIEAIVSGPERDPRKYIAAFVEVADLAEVSATPVAGSMRLDFTLPVREAAP